MSARTRFIPARVVGPVEFAGETAVAGPRKKLTRKQKTIRRLLRKARALKKRIAHLKIRQPLGWKGAVKQAKTKLVAAALEKLGFNNALIVDGAEVDAGFSAAARNIPNIDVLPVQGINVYDILRRKTLVLTKAAVDALEARFK
jgi:large subunit ribosomal protein L4